MISKQMCAILKEIPHSPTTTTFTDMSAKKLLDVNLLMDLLSNALENKYIAYAFRNPYNNLKKDAFSLTELGQIAIEEHEGTKYNSALSTWALVVAALSFVVAIIALFVS